MADASSLATGAESERVDSHCTNPLPIILEAVAAASRLFKGSQPGVDCEPPNDDREEGVDPGCPFDQPEKDEEDVDEGQQATEMDSAVRAAKDALASTSADASATTAPPGAAAASTHSSEAESSAGVAAAASAVAPPEPTLAPPTVAATVPGAGAISAAASIAARCGGSTSNNPPAVPVVSVASDIELSIELPPGAAAGMRVGFTLPDGRMARAFVPDVSEIPGWPEQRVLHVTVPAPPKPTRPLSSPECLEPTVMIDAILDVSETVRVHALDAVTAVSISPDDVTRGKHPKRIVPADMRKVLAAGGAALSFGLQTGAASE